MRIVAFHTLAFEQYNECATSDRKIFERVRRLITESAKTPSPELENPNRLNETSKGTGPAVSAKSTALSIKSLMSKSLSYRASFIIMSKSTWTGSSGPFSLNLPDD